MLMLEFHLRQKDRAGKNKQGKWNLLECYQVDRASGTITAVDKSTCRTTFLTGQASRFFITFSFTPPDLVFRKLIFGDIRFNIKVSEQIFLIK